MSSHERAQIQQQLESLDKEAQRILPTAEQAQAVRWFERGNMKLSYPAIVDSQQGPGKLKLIIFRGGRVITKENVLHVGHEQFKNDPGGYNARTFGSWDYPKNQNTPKISFAMHEQDIDDRRERLNQRLNELDQEDRRRNESDNNVLTPDKAKT